MYDFIWLNEFFAFVLIFNFINKIFEVIYLKFTINLKRSGNLNKSWI
jgi:hypothetical protein